MTHKIVVCDIDGVLADSGHRNHYVAGDDKDWPAFFETCEMDSPIDEHIRPIDGLIYRPDVQVFLVTGRPESVRKRTERWLARFSEHLADYPLCMRPNDDRRPPWVLKRSFWRHKINIVSRSIEPYMAFDDDPRVCQMWKEEIGFKLINPWGSAQLMA